MESRVHLISLANWSFQNDSQTTHTFDDLMGALLSEAGPIQVTPALPAGAGVDLLRLRRHAVGTRRYG